MQNSRSSRILITGSNGQLGTALLRSFAGCGQIFSFNRQSLDLRDPAAITRVFEEIKPDIVLNAAAYTAVDRAEVERTQAFAINATAPRVLAAESRRCDALFIHYSTDYVFDGSKEGAWSEDDAPNPLNVYGESKLAGETAVRDAGGSSLIFRTSWVYGPQGHNFLRTMLRLGRERQTISVVNDQIGAPTSTFELADATRKIVEGIAEGKFGPAGEWAGIYHMTCRGATSWLGFADAIFARAKGRLQAAVPELKPIASENYPTPARRPMNSVLNNEKLARRFGIELKPWEMALDQVFDGLIALETEAQV